MARVADPELAERRRRQILEAALVCFSRRGFHQATMSEICAECGLSAGALYRYFPSKTDIIVAIAEEHRREVMEGLGAIDKDAPVIEMMLKVIEAALDKISALGGSLIGDVIAEASRDPTLAARLKRSDESVRTLLRAGLVEGRRRGRVSADVDPDAATRIIEAFLDGVILRLAIIHDVPRSQVMADARLFLTRLLAPADPLSHIAQPTPKATRRAHLSQEG